MFEIYRKTLLAHLELILQENFPKNESLRNVCHYALIPPGKLFRPLLTLCAYKDIYQLDPLINTSLLFTALSFEIHHTYTLIHDDMPCMDNDDMRRNRPSVHKQFGEWMALLAGDALLNISYSLLAKHSGNLCYGMSKMCGPMGLIQGQFLDLEHERKNIQELDITLIDKIHCLKTARLIQLSLMGCLFINKQTKPKWKDFYALYKIGHYLGMYFQYNDDLLDFKQNPTLKDGHEYYINPFYKNYDLSLSKKNYYSEKLKELLNHYSLFNLKKLIEDFQSAG